MSYAVTTPDGEDGLQEFEVRGYPAVKKSQHDSVYIALRSMLQTRVLSPETRQRIKTAMRRVNEEAAKQTLREVVFEDSGRATAD